MVNNHEANENLPSSPENARPVLNFVDEVMRTAGYIAVSVLVLKTGLNEFGHTDVSHPVLTGVSTGIGSLLAHAGRNTPK